MDDIAGRLGTSSRKRSNSVTSVEDYRTNDFFSSSGKNLTNDVEAHTPASGHSTPIADFFEALRLKLKKFMTHTRAGRFYENTLLTLSVVSCLEYIYQTYQRDKRTLHDLNVIELVFASIFAFDWCINCFLAEHRLIFFTSFFSMVDLLTVVPIFVTYGRPMPNVNYIYTLGDALLYMAYGMSTTRILRALRIRRKLAKIEDAVERFMGELTLSIIVMILFFASVMQFLEFTYQPNDYHTWMYYIWVTISTVGYGDITPMSTQGRVAVMCIIGFSIISIPKMTNELIEKMALQSVYMRNTYTPKSRKSKHIVICGDISSLSLTEFFEELFHEDHENVDLNAIMLLPCPPTTEMIFLLRDSAFFLNLMYLEGSALIDKDLKRAKAQSAEAIFIMTNKFSNRPDEEDAKSILLNLSIKRYVASFHLPPQLFCLQLIRPSNRKHLGRDEGYNQVDELDLVVCLNEIKMGMLAKAVLYPGANTLLMNLISSFSDGEIADQEDDKSGGSANWVNEYTQGCGWEIYTSQLSVKFEGESFANLSYKLYKKIGLILFALQITDSMGRSKLLLNPADYVIPVGQSQNVLAFVIAENKASSDLTFSSQPAEAEAKTGGLLDAVLNRVQIVKKKLDAQGHDAAEWIADKSSAHSQYFAVDSADEPPAATKLSSVNRRSSCVAPGRDVSPTPIARTSSIDIVTSMSDANINLESRNECLIHLKETHFKRSYYTRETPISLKEATIKGSLVDVVPDVQNHLIIVGKGLSNLFDLIRPLRAKYLGTLRPIVILSPDTIEHDVWSRISMFDAVYFIRGSALEERNLRRAGIFKARRVVVLADGTADASSAAGSMAALVDSDAIFAYQRVRKMNPRAQVVIEIVNTSNIGYLYTPSHEIADGLNAQIDPADIPTDYKFSQQFAAGELFTTSLLDSIVCQGYYNPHIISVIDKLISGSDLMARNEMLASFSESSEPEPTPQKPSAMMHGRSFRLDSRSGSQGDLNVPSFAGGPRPRLASESSAGAGAEEVELSKLQGSCFYQIPLPEDMATRSYGSLYKRLSKKGIIPLGLLRGVASTSASFSSKAAPAPYVYTNPTFDTELNAGDRVFILSVRPISDNIEEEQPGSIGAHSTGITNNKPGTAPHRGLARTGTEDLTSSVMHHQLQQDFRDLSMDVNRKFEMIMGMLQGGQTFAAVSTAPQTLSINSKIIPEIAPRPAKFALSPLPPLKVTPASGTATVLDGIKKKNSALSSERSAQALPQHEETKYEEPQQGTNDDSVAQDQTPPDSATGTQGSLVRCTPGPAIASTYSPMVFTFPKARTRTRGGSIGLDPATSTGSLTSEDPLLNSSPRQLDRKKPVSGAKPS